MSFSTEFKLDNLIQYCAFWIIDKIPYVQKI